MLACTQRSSPASSIVRRHSFLPFQQQQRHFIETRRAQQYHQHYYLYFWRSRHIAAVANRRFLPTILPADQGYAASVYRYYSSKRKNSRQRTPLIESLRAKIPASEQTNMAENTLSSSSTETDPPNSKINDNNTETKDVTTNDDGDLSEEELAEVRSTIISCHVMSCSDQPSCYFAHTNALTIYSLAAFFILG
jgi:hypothetical protein